MGDVVYVAPADHPQHVFRLTQQRMDRRDEDGSPELVVVLEAHELLEPREVDRTIALLEIRGVQREDGEQSLLQAIAHRGAHLESDSLTAPAPPQLLLDRSEEVLDLFLVDVQVAVPSDPKCRVVEDRDAWKELRQAPADHVRQEDVAALPVVWR